MQGANHQHIHKHVMDGLSGYEKIKKAVVDHHDEAVDHVNHVKKNLINIGLN